jgi:predicted enzyme related to lactoylglutathione lyase
MGERTSYTPGRFCWVDLVVEDQNAAKTFYTGLFGWDYQDFPIGDGSFYSVAQVDARAVAAIVPLPDPSMPPHWNCYVSVEDADAAAGRAEETPRAFAASRRRRYDARLPCGGPRRRSSTADGRPGVNPEQGDHRGAPQAHLEYRRAGLGLVTGTASPVSGVVGGLASFHYLAAVLGKVRLSAVEIGDAVDRSQVPARK